MSFRLYNKLCDIHKSNQIESNSQLTNESNSICKKLCDIHKSNQIESNSQPPRWGVRGEICCVISTKVIKLKAIHNNQDEILRTHIAV